MAERKRCLDTLDRVDKGKKLKMETLDLFLSNAVPPSKIARIADAALAAGITEMEPSARTLRATSRAWR